MDGRKKILILTADAGYGHRAAATAVADALRQSHGDACEVIIENPLDDRRAPKLLRFAQNDYDRIVRVAPEWYRFGYRASDGVFPIGLVEQALIMMLSTLVRDILQRHKPDAVLLTYPLYQAPIAAVFAMDQHYVPLFTVVTDLVDVHGLWFYDEVDGCLVPTAEVKDLALENGVPKGRVEVTGLPVNPALARPRDREKLRLDLGWSQDRVVVLCSGGTRVKRIEPVADVLNHSGFPLELVLISGGDDGLLARWEAAEWHLPAHVHGFVDNMADMMQAADFIVCKAGGLIVSESLAAGLPLLLVEAIPGQETGNASYVVRGGAGLLVDGAIEGLKAVQHWLADDRAQLREAAANACKLGRPYAAQRVAELIWGAAVAGTQRREHRLLAQVPLLRELLSSSSSSTPTRESAGSGAPIDGGY